MINRNSDTTDIVLDFEVTTGEIIPLEPHYYTQAIEISDRVPTKARQWQTYLNMLGLSAFEEWLKERAFDIRVDKTQCSVLQPQYANVFEAVCNLKVGKFKLCLIVTESLLDRVVTVPRAAIDLPEFTAHLYVVIEVLEEEEQVIIHGFFGYDKLQKAQKSHILELDEETWVYQLSLDLFELDPNHLLFCLRLANPAVFGLPEPQVNRLAALSQMRESLERLLPKLATPNAELCKVLNWKQAVALYTSPELLEHLYKLQTQPLIEDGVAITNSSKEPYTPRLQQVINVGLWLQDRMDELTQNFSWVLLPAFSPGVSFRDSSSVLTGKSPAEEFKYIFSNLVRKGEIEISPTVGNAYKEMSLAGTPLQLYAGVWSLYPQIPKRRPTEAEIERPQEPIREWTLLLILRPQPGTNLPYGIKLQVSDQAGFFDEVELKRETNADYLYLSAIGSWDEKFLVTIALKDGETLPLPLPFAFVSEQPL